ncbi:MAG: TraB/GumN family protein [Desulfatiglandales bacterium]
MVINWTFSRNRRQWLFIFLLFACYWTFVNITCAQESLQVKRKNNFLWCIETGENTIYLLGSLHVLKSDTFPLGKEIEEAYSDCKKIVLETDLDRINDPGFQATVMSLGLYPDAQTLKQNVSEQAYGLLKKKVNAVGLSLSEFDRFKPWICALILTSMEFQRLGFHSRYGVDTYFLNKANKDGKEIIFLETPEYQLGLFTKMGKTEQESFLRQTLKELEVLETMASEMANSWKTGDVDKLESIIKISFKEHPDMYDRFIVQRNRKWVSQITDLMKQNDNVLVIVGAGHLVGTESILELLEKAIK